MTPARRRISVVLCRPLYPRNVGMCARAVANMGGARLVVIGARCRLDDEQAKQGAAGAQEALRAAVGYPGWDEFMASEGAGVLIGLSGKAGRLRVPDLLEDRLQSLGRAEVRIVDPATPICLVFGPEEDGLAARELDACHHVCRLSTFGDFFSLNLSHAVLLALYVVQRFFGADAMPCEGLAPFNSARAALLEKRTARGGDGHFPGQAIDEWLVALGFDLSDRRVHAGNVLKRILLENEPTEDELRVLDAVIRQTTRKLGR